MLTLTRALRMTYFDFELNTEGAPISASGKIDGDTVLILAITSGKTKPDTQRIAVSGAVLLPTTVPWPSIADWVSGIRTRPRTIASIGSWRIVR